MIEGHSIGYIAAYRGGILRYRIIEIRRRIKASSKQLLMKTLMPAIKLCILLTAIYLIVLYIRLFASPVMEVKGTGFKAIIDAYIGMSWKQLLSIVVINVLSIIVLGPVMCCFSEFFIKITEKRKQPSNDYSLNGEDEPLIDVEDLKVSRFLHWFSKSNFRSKAIMLRLALFLLSIFWHIIYVGPPLVLLYLLRGNPNSIQYTNKVFVYTNWMLIGYLLTYIRLGTYYPSYFLIARHPQMPIREAIRDSAKMMRGHSVEFFRYKLSFLPWYILCVVTFGFALIYVVPYRGTCDAKFVRYIDSVSSEGNLPW